MNVESDCQECGLHQVSGRQSRSMGAKCRFSFTLMIVKNVSPMGQICQAVVKLMRQTVGKRSLRAIPQVLRIA